MSDLIDRQAAIDECYPITVDGEVYEVVQVETLMGLPSAQPTQTNAPNALKSLDCISRQAAIEALKPCAGVGNRALDKLRALPSVESEIVRCKDCRHFEADIMANPWGVCCHDGWVDGHSGHEVSESGWCYRAERRTNGSD